MSCYDPDPDFSDDVLDLLEDKSDEEITKLAESLAAAQKAREDAHEQKEEDRDHARCVVCKALVLEAKGYRTGAGFICAHCSHEFSDESQR
jgi:pyruvate dehydrogenase complex dehydrogenase (E1) component